MRRTEPKGCARGERSGMEKAVIMDIQRYSIHDGPGIRTTVFFKGCHMACRWCHNPESQDPEPELLYYAERCIGCKACAALCGRNAHGWEAGRHSLALDRCRHCPKMERCAECCPAEAIRLCGRRMDTGEVLEQVLRDRLFYGTEGGVTCSGGEALLQDAFLAEFLPMCKREGISTCVDTTLNVEWETVERLLGCVDLFLADLKFMDPVLHRKYTGADGGRTLANLQRLSEAGRPVILRMPMAGGINDTGEEEAARKRLLESLSNIVRVDRFPVTDHGAAKYRALQRKCVFFEERKNRTGNGTKSTDRTERRK